MSIRKLILRALAASNEPYTEADVLRELASGEAKAFVEDDSILILNLHEVNGERSVHCWLGAGDLQVIRDVLVPRSEGWARSQGCTRATFEGRRGWVRALKDAGYSEQSVVVGKAL